MQMQKEADNRLKLISKRRKLNEMADVDSYANISDDDLDSGESCPPQSDKDMDENRGYVIPVEGTKMKLWCKPNTAITKDPEEIVIDELEPYSQTIERLRNLADNWRGLIESEKDEICYLLNQQKRALANPPWLRRRHLSRKLEVESTIDKEEEELRIKFPQIRNYRLIAGKRQPMHPLHSCIMGQWELNWNTSNNNELSIIHRENVPERFRFNRLFNSKTKNKYNINKTKEFLDSKQSQNATDNDKIHEKGRNIQNNYKNIMIYNNTENNYEREIMKDNINNLYITHSDMSVDEQFSNLHQNQLNINNYEQKLTKTLNPDSRFVKIVHLFGALATYLSITLSSYRLSFTDERLIFKIILFILDFIIFLEILCKTRVQIRDANDDLISDWKEIFKNYLINYFGFFFDLLSILPIELFFNKFQIKALIRLLRSLLRFVYLIEFFNSWRYVLHANIFYMRGAACFVYLSLTIHLSACIWFWVGCPYGYCMEKSWVNRIRGIRNETNSIEKRILYLDSLYFIAATITTTGYGDIVPKTFWEMVVACFIVIFGKVIYI